MMKVIFASLMFCCAAHAVETASPAATSGTAAAANNAAEIAAQIPNSTTNAKTNLMQEREQALFDAKEVNLDKVDSPKLKESELLMHVDSPKDKAPEKTGMLRILLSLGVVFGLLGGAIFALKTWSKKRLVQNDNMKIRMLTQYHLGPKKSIAIVQVAGESILVGITDHNISMLKTLALIDDEIPAGQPNKFNEALYNFEEEEGEISKHFLDRQPEEADDFALKGISEIRDVVSKRLKGMRSLE